jgi:hypothetical protein
MKDLFFFFLLITSTAALSQSLPANTCGVLYSYDASGNRTGQTYLCNNTGRSANPSTQKLPQTATLYPNPTTGVFKVTFTKPLKETQAQLLNLTGQILQQKAITGTELEFNIESYPSGIYWVKINDSPPITLRVVKR